jgi:hypothetical protein
MLKCKFFHWMGSSPSALPSTTQIATMASAPVPAATVDHIVSMGDGTCAHPDCQTMCLASGCVNTQCQCHCWLLRNCSFKSHIVNTSAPVPTVPAATLQNSYIPSWGSVSLTMATSLCPQPSTSTLFVPQATTSLDVHTDSNFSSPKASSHQLCQLPQCLPYLCLTQQIQPFNH